MTVLVIFPFTADADADAADERTWTQADIVQSQFSDPRVELQQQGQGLPDTASSTKDRHFGRLEPWWIHQRRHTGSGSAPDYLSRRCGESPTLDLSKQLSCERHFADQTKGEMRKTESREEQRSCRW